MTAVAFRVTSKVTLPTDEQILITRELDAPRELVYRAWTTPELVKRWWAGERGEMTVAEIDLRVGGSWRYAMVTKEGHEVAFRGKYLEVVPYERIVYSEVFEDQPERRAQTAVTFTELDGRTVLAILVEYASRRDRDAHRDYMGDGMQEAFHLLERAARSLAAGTPDSQLATGFSRSPSDGEER